MKELDLLRFPLSGRQLIEASAGTGKTYSITALHLRALLGHGVPAPVAVDRLLVVTFTNAATDELRGRVRSRLVRMRDRLQSGLPGDDTFNEALAADLPPGDVARATATLDLAVQSLDAAAIYTIDAFCLHVLREFAFDSGVAFDQEFVADDSDYLHTALTDVWRRLVYPATGGEVGAGPHLNALWPTPEHLWRDVKDLLRRRDLELRGAETASVAAANGLLNDAILAFKAVARAARLADVLKGSNLSTNAADGPAHWSRIDALRTLLAAPGAQGRGPDGQAIVNFIRVYTTLALSKAGLKRGTNFDTTPIGVAADRVVAASQQLRARALRDVFDTARADAAREKTRRGVLAPDDLLRRTSAALSGERGAAFARKLRQRYPVAMIDEFQDTDALQWQIFARIYRAGADPATACVLIGDPKQAIYGFRGADIFSYLDARGAIGGAGRHHLTVTRRATAPLANALNALYARAEPQPFLLNDIDYAPVASAIDGEIAGFTRAGVDLPPLVFWHLDLNGRGMIASGPMVNAMAGVAAARIDALLSGDHAVDGRAIAPGDLAILVRNRKEADTMRRALARLGRDAAFLNRGSVFASETATLVRLLLIALIDPNDDARVRAVLVSRIGGWDVVMLAAGQADDGLWQRQTERFHGLAQIASQRGVLAMLRAAVLEFGLAARWLAHADGARWLTDLRHTGELLQTESARLGGGARLLRWLEQRIAAADSDSDDAHLMRLESDEDLIKIVTLHGAKGLEYPVVILPFVSAFRVTEYGVFHEPIDGGIDTLRDPGQASNHRPIHDLSDTPHPQIDHERLAEDLRMLYVGLTRAKRACFVGVANCASHDLSVTRGALGRLLLGDAPTAGDAELGAALDRLTRDCPDIGVESVVAGGGARALPGAVALAAAAAEEAALVVVGPAEAGPAEVGPAEAGPKVRSFNGTIDASWKIFSYSSLTRAASAEYTAPGADDEDGDDQVASSAAESAIQYQFPRGAAAGVLLHKLLERWPPGDPHAFVSGELRSAVIGGDALRVQAQTTDVVQWLTTVRSQPLAPLGVALHDLARGRAEMAFELPLAPVPTARLWRVLAAHGYRGDPLPPQQLHGMLRGYIDLVFEQDGRYYIVDYKSNFLGGHAAAYAANELAVAMRGHRYDLQFLLYAVAVRRWLAVHGRAGVTPEVFYFFLRGIAAPGGGIHHHVPTAAVLDELDDLFAGVTPAVTRRRTR